MRVAVALVQYPCLDEHGEIYTTSITNLDIHDIARCGTTYGVDAFYIATPISAQRSMAETITSYWDSGAGRARNPSRTTAMQTVHVVASAQDAIAGEAAVIGAPPLVVVTARAGADNGVTCAQLRERMSRERGVLLLFGTGYGLAPSIVDAADVVLAPLPGRLSARATASIVLDRLLG